jgi:hypothetical protein
MKDLGEYSITGSRGGWIRELFFYLGLVGALGLRIVLILNNINPYFAKLTSYIAIVSLMAYYYYRKWIEQKRRQIIIEGDLISKVKTNKLSAEDRRMVTQILGSTIVSKQMLNLNILYYSSIVALVIQAAIDIKIIR